MTSSPTELDSPGEDSARGHRSRPPLYRRRGVLIALAGVVVVAGVVVAVTVPFDGGRASGSTNSGASGTSLATVTRQSLSQQTNVNGTLGYAGSYSVVNLARGTVTSLPSIGQVIYQGQSLYQVNRTSVGLLYGSIPAYRSLAEGMSGADVSQLNHDLVQLGYATKGEIGSGWGQFGSATTSAVEKLQSHLGLSKTGMLTLGQVAFLPSAARTTSVAATVGAPAPPGQPLIRATSTTRQVTINLDATQQSYVKPGDSVTITLPDNSTTQGRVTSVGTVAITPPSSGSSSGSQTPTITVEVSPLDPAATGELDQAPVTVAITTASVASTLVVPVDALLAKSGGGYQVEVAGAGGSRRLEQVTLGLFDDAAGLVQVTGPQLQAGQRVVVPSL